MQRFDKWLQSTSADFWRSRFKPKDLLRVLSFTNSVFSQRQDARLMERYDIEDLYNHSVGSTKIWEEIEFGDPRVVEESDGFIYEYDIDENWLYIDAIYDKHVDPTICLQHDIDYKFYIGKIRFNRELPQQPFYISKGRYAEYRIYEHLGHFLDFKRRDSELYRDYMEPIMAAFYEGPTYVNLVAVLNALQGLPVAKFGDETVISIKGNVVETDKYIYPMGAAVISVKEGDVLYKFQPLSDCVKLITHETNPYWWRDRPVDLFAKYRVDGPIDYRIMDYIMRTFLYDAVAYVLYDYTGSDRTKFQPNPEVWDLFLDALPTRTDIFQGEQYRAYSWDTADGEIMDPDDSYVKIAPHVASMYGLKKTSNNEYYIYAPDLGRPTWEDTTDKDTALTINDYHWHLFDEDETDNWREQWKQTPNQASHVEVNYDRVYLRLVETTDVEHIEGHIDDRNIKDLPEDQGIVVRNGSGGSDSTLFSTIPMDMEAESVTYNTVPGDILSTVLDMDEWEISNLDIAQNALELGDATEGYAITPVYQVGYIPKDVVVSTTSTILDDTDIKVYYRIGSDTEWELYTTRLKKITGTVQFKIVMTGTDEDTPSLQMFWVKLDYTG